MQILCRLTQRWEASLWLAGKQMYLGGFQDEDDAARAYDLAALACKGLSVPTNFPVEGYTESLTEIGGSSRVSPRCAAHVCGCSDLALTPAQCPLNHGKSFYVIADALVAILACFLLQRTCRARHAMAPSTAV